MNVIRHSADDPGSAVVFTLESMTWIELIRMFARVVVGICYLLSLIYLVLDFYSPCLCHRMKTVADLADAQLMRTCFTPNPTNPLSNRFEIRGYEFDHSHYLNRFIRKELTPTD